MSTDEFWSCFPRWFFLRLKGYKEQTEQRELNEWARTRWLLSGLLNISGKTMKQNITPQELLPLSFDEETKEQPESIWTDELIKQIEEQQRQDRIKASKN